MTDFRSKIAELIAKEQAGLQYNLDAQKAIDEDPKLIEWLQDAVDASTKENNFRIEFLKAAEEFLPVIFPHLVNAAPRTIGQAIDVILQQGPHRYGDIKRRIADEYPGITVTDADKSVTAALLYGLRTGKYLRLERGVYALAEKKEAGNK